MAISGPTKESVASAGFVTVEEPFNFKDDFSDWKLSVDYEFTEDILGYIQVATGYRSEGSVARPWNPTQLGATSNEELLSYEIGTKADFFDNRLRVNAAIFYQEYDPRVISDFGYQCNDWRTMEREEEPIYVFPWPTATCPEGTDFAGGGLATSQPYTWLPPEHLKGLNWRFMPGQSMGWISTRPMAIIHILRMSRRVIQAMSIRTIDCKPSIRLTLALNTVSISITDQC